jgi:hypothetical protein
VWAKRTLGRRDARCAVVGSVPPYSWRRIPAPSAAPPAAGQPPPGVGRAALIRVITIAVMTASIPTPVRSATGGLGTALRLVVTLGAIAVLGQGLLAGQILVGDSGALLAHGDGALIVVAIGLVQLIVAVVAWRRRRAPGSVALVSGLVLLAVVGQTVAGAMSLLAVHVPLAVAIFGGYAALSSTVWRR